MNPLLKVDYYKTEHFRMLPEGTTQLYSNLTPRKSRMKGVESVLVFGIQHFLLEYLIKDFNENFFGKPKEEVIKEYQEEIHVDTKHIEALHDLQYLPIRIKSLKEGAFCPIGVPILIITNTHKDFAWLVNYVETLMSCVLWQPITSATIAHEYKKLLSKHAIETTGNADGVQWQGHDFSMRGMSSPESAILSGMGHLTAFTGTDTVPAIYQLKKSYFATGLIGASVPATEHSIQCMGEKEQEINTFSRLLSLYPKGILSVVSDTWDLWKVCTEFLPKLKGQIFGRDGKLVIRPDSGDPVDIICGTATKVSKLPFDGSGRAYNKTGFKTVIYDGKYYQETGEEYHNDWIEVAFKPEFKGVVELLWDVFNGVTSEQGYKILDSHIGAIYGDSITLERAEQICTRLRDKGFASTNVVFGIGSFTYQYNTRDTFGFAVKATYGEVLQEVFTVSNTESGPALMPIGREIFKDPITDDGTKKSKKGLLYVGFSPETGYFCKDQVGKETENDPTNRHELVFENSQLRKKTDLDQIRNIIDGKE